MGAAVKPHYRLHCKFLPCVPRLGMTILMWRVGEYGAWFQQCRSAVNVVTEEAASGPSLIPGVPHGLA